MTPPPSDADLPAARDDAVDTPWPLPGRLVRRLMAITALAVVLAGAAATWVVSLASGQEALRRLVSQQTDEVEVVARLLASKVEQSQKVLATVAEGISPGALDSPSSLEWLLQQGLPAVRFFDAMQVARHDGTLRVNLQYGRLEKASNLDPAEREYLLRTLVEGKPLVSELIGTRAADARIMFTMPLHQSEGAVMGAVAGVLRLQSQGLFPPSMALPARDDSRLIVFTREGVILSHPDPSRVLRHVRDEPGLSAVYARWVQQEQPLGARGHTEVLDSHVVSMAGMPLPQWMVARVSDVRALTAPLAGAQRRAWWLAAGSILLVAVLAMAALAVLAAPLARLRHQAQTLHARPSEADAHAEEGTRPEGEIHALTAALQALRHERGQHQVHTGTLAGQLQSILDHAPVGIVITRGTVIERLGLQAGRMLGYAPRELQGRTSRTLYASATEYGAARERVRTEFAAHGAFDGDVAFTRKDGSRVRVRVQGRSVPDGRELPCHVWILEDTAAPYSTRAPFDAGMLDGLTQLPDRPAFLQRLAQVLSGNAECAKTVPTHQSGDLSAGVVLFIDLDHLTVVNDIAGHDAGDDVLRHVARLVEAQVRQIGWAARLGGDEFGVVLPGCTLARGQAVAEQLRAAVQAWEPAYGGRTFTLGASIGLVAFAQGQHAVGALLHAADMACYDAKRAGRNCVVIGAVPSGSDAA